MKQPDHVAGIRYLRFCTCSIIACGLLAGLLLCLQQYYPAAFQWLLETVNKFFLFVLQWVKNQMV